MLDAALDRIRRLLRIPPAPDPPAGDPASVRIFRASPGFYRYRLLGWGWQQLSTIAGFVFGIVLLRTLARRFGDAGGEVLAEIPRWLLGTWYAVEAAAILLFLVQAFFSFLLVTLDYRSRWYVVTDRSLRIREGIWRVEERTMTYSNVQNLSVRQGPIQRLFGIADLRVKSAGGAGGGEGKDAERKDLHVGFFRGVDNAAEIRALVRAHQKRARTAAADEAPEPAPPEATVDPTLAAARDLLTEARALTAALS